MNDRSAGHNLFSFITHAIDTCLVWISIAVGAVLAVNMIVAVFYRYVLDSPIFWADELSLYLFCWSAFLGASLAVKRSDMAAMTFLLNRLPGRMHTLGSAVIQVCILFFAVVMGYYSVTWISSPSIMNLLSPALSLKVWILYTILPVSLFCMAIFSIEHLIGLLKELFGGKREGIAP